MRFTVAASFLSFLIACGSEEKEDLISLPGLEEGDHLRGDQVITFEVKGGLAVAEAELYVGDVRVAAAPFHPFDLAWNTRLFPDGRYPLRVHARLDDGSFLDEKIKVVIDNTPPVLPNISGYSATPGERLRIHAVDNIGVDLLLVTSSAWSQTLELRTPFQIASWPAGCGEYQMTVQAYDRAGNQSSHSYPVTAAVPGDDDCDGERALLAGGKDCDDTASWIRPGLPEPAEGFDVNCDGVVAERPGVDDDGDGVPSISDGGGDCNDSDPTVYGEHLVFDRYVLTRDSQPVQWVRGEAALGNAASPSLFLNHAGTIEEWHPTQNQTAPVATLSTGANPGSLALAREAQILAYGRDNQVELLRREAGGWVLHSSFATQGRVGMLQLSRSESAHSQGFLSVVYQAGTEVWLATRPEGGAWTQRLIFDAELPLIEISPLRSDRVNAQVVLRTQFAAWAATRFEEGGFQVRNLHPLALRPVALAAEPNQLLVATVVNENVGSTIYMSRSANTAPPKQLRVSERVIGVVAVYRKLYLQLEDGSVQVVHFENLDRKGQRFAPMEALDAFSFSDYTNLRGFASHGVVYVASARSIAAPTDPSDSFDRNCNGVDH